MVPGRGLRLLPVLLRVVLAKGPVGHLAGGAEGHAGWYLPGMRQWG